MPSVQFHSTADVLTAFDNIKCPAWALLRDGKNFMYKGIGREELDGFLELLNESGASNAVYTLAYFEGVTEKKNINSKTPFDGSFNFKLNADNQEINNNQYNSFFKQQSLLSKVNGLESRVDKLIELMSNEHEPETDNKLGVIGVLLEHPAIAPVIPVLVQKIIDAFTNPKQPAPVYPLQNSGVYQVPAKVSGIDQQPTATAPADYYNSGQIDKAVHNLLRHDKNLAEHLEKLVWLAENSKPTFDLIMSQLDQMQTN